MQNLIYLIIMALAGGAGWYAGSWSGRDAKSAVAAAQVAGKEIEGSREKIQTDLDSKIKTLTLAHDAELVQLQSKFDGESAGWKTTLAARDAMHFRISQLRSRKERAKDYRPSDLKRARITLRKCVAGEVARGDSKLLRV